MFPDTYVFAEFWTYAYYLAAIYFAHRFLTVFYFVKKYKIKPMAKEDIPNLRESMKKGWKSALLPFIVFTPFWVNNTFGDTFVVERLGGGATGFGSNLIIIAPSLAIMYVFLIAKDRSSTSIPALLDTMKTCVKIVSPIVMLMVGGYAIAELFADVGVMEAMMRDLERVQIPFWAVIIFMPIVLAFIGCFFDGLAVLTLLGPVVLTLTTSVGISPWLAASMLPAIIHAMCHLTPPYAPGIMIASNLAKSKFLVTCKYMVIWIAGHYLVSLLIFFRIIPIIGGHW